MGLATEKWLPGEATNNVTLTNLRLVVAAIVVTVGLIVQ
jgi:hypothetical protein